MKKWVSVQRIKHGNMLKGKKGDSMTPEQAKKLDDLGMVWSINKPPPPEKRADRKPWSHRFQELVDFKEEYGHTFVPHDYPVLGLWVYSQRVNYKLMKRGRKTRMTPERALLLADIDFAYEVRKPRKKSKNQSLGNPYPHLPLIASRNDLPNKVGTEDGNVKARDRSNIYEEETLQQDKES
jgi:hypothetical protein